MQTFTLRAPCRLETHAQIWDSKAERWETRKLAKPRLVQNPPQDFSPDEKAFIDSYRDALIRSIKANREARDADLNLIALRGE